MFPGSWGEGQGLSGRSFCAKADEGERPLSFLLSAFDISSLTVSSAFFLISAFDFILLILFILSQFQRFSVSAFQRFRMLAF
jgi:hypothetical protein